MKNILNNRWLNGIGTPLAFGFFTSVLPLFFGFTICPAINRYYCFGNAYLSPLEIRILVVMGIWAITIIILWAYLGVGIWKSYTKEGEK